MTRGLLRDAVHALRMGTKNPGFSVVVVLTLAVGIGAVTAMFSLLNATLIRALPFPSPDRLVIGRTTSEGNPPAGSVSAPDYRDYRDGSESFESLAAIRSWVSQGTITGGDEPERIESISLSANFFETLGVLPRLGRGFSPEEGKRGADGAVIISHDYWKRRFGGTGDGLGVILTVDGNPYTIVGVMPSGFHFMFATDLWFPMDSDKHSELPRRWDNWILLGRLQPGWTMERAQSHVDVIARQLEAQYPDSNSDESLLLEDLHAFTVKRARPSLLVLMGAVALVLLISCSNVAGLLLARGSGRRHELAMRVAMGASRMRLVRQLLTESLMAALVASALGIVLAFWIQDVLVRFLPLQGLGIESVGIDTTVLLVALATSVGTAFLFGMAPALRGAQANPTVDLRAHARAATDRGESVRLRGALIVGQLAVSVVLLIGSGLLLRSLAHLQSTELGFHPDHLLTAEIELPVAGYPEPHQQAQFFEALTDDLRARPEISGVGVISLLPIREPRNTTSIYAADNPPGTPGTSGTSGTSGDDEFAYVRSVLPGYFEAMQIPLLAGRDVEASDRDGTAQVMVINQTMATRVFPDRSPLGRDVVVDLLTRGLLTLRVVGVVGDVRIRGLGLEPRPVFYFAYAQHPETTMQVALRTAGEPETAVPFLRSAVRRLDKNIPVASILTMDEAVADTLAERRVVAVFLTTFTLVAVLLASIGLYGVLSFHVGQRTHEIGIRMALGASGPEILRHVLRRGMTLAVAGLGVGLVAALATTRFLQSLLFGTLPMDPLTFAGATVFILCVAMLACWIPARRAMRVDPALSLQAE